MDGQCHKEGDVRKDRGTTTEIINSTDKRIYSIIIGYEIFMLAQKPNRRKIKRETSNKGQIKNPFYGCLSKETNLCKDKGNCPLMVGKNDDDQ